MKLLILQGFPIFGKSYYSMIAHILQTRIPAGQICQEDAEWTCVGETINGKLEFDLRKIIG